MAIEPVLASVFTGLGAVLFLVVVGISRGWFKQVRPSPSLSVQQTAPITANLSFTPEVNTQTISDAASPPASDTTVDLEKTSAEPKIEVAPDAIILPTEPANPEITYSITTASPVVDAVVEAKETVETPIETANPQIPPCGTNQRKTHTPKRTRRQSAKTKKVITSSP